MTFYSKIVLKRFFNILLCLPLKKNKVTSPWKFKDPLKNLHCAGLLMPCLLYMNLNYSINSRPSHHYNYNFFFITLLLQQLAFLQLQTWMTLFTSFTQAPKHIFWSVLPGWYNYMKKTHPGETIFLICENEISVAKNIPPSRDWIIFTCNQHCLFYWKCYLNGI